MTSRQRRKVLLSSSGKKRVLDPRRVCYRLFSTRGVIREKGKWEHTSVCGHRAAGDQEEKKYRERDVITKAPKVTHAIGEKEKIILWATHKESGSSHRKKRGRVRQRPKAPRFLADRKRNAWRKKFQRAMKGETKEVDWGEGKVRLR